MAIEEPALLDALQRPGGLIEASNDDFSDLARLCRELELIRD